MFFFKYALFLFKMLVIFRYYGGFGFEVVWYDREKKGFYLVRFNGGFLGRDSSQSEIPLESMD